MNIIFALLFLLIGFILGFGFCDAIDRPLFDEYQELVETLLDYIKSERKK